MRRLLAVPFRLAGNTAYVLSQAFDVAHAMVSGEAYR